MRRIKFGIETLDYLFEDGMPEGSNVLVYGKPGSGKTILGLEYLYKGAENYGEAGLYVSLEQSAEALQEQCERFGWTIAKHLKSGKLKIMYFKMDEVDRNFANIILEEASKIKAKRIVIDTLAFLSLSPIFKKEEKFTLLDGKNVRIAYDTKQFIYNLIHIINQSNATCLYLTMSDENSISSIDGISEYVCDGIIHLMTRSMGKVSIRALEVLKMRKSKIKGGMYVFDITDEGVVVEK